MQVMGAWVKYLDLGSIQFFDEFLSLEFFVAWCRMFLGFMGKAFVKKLWGPYQNPYFRLRGPCKTLISFVADIY